MIPERYKARCEFCGDDLNITDDGVHQFTSGWVKNRASGGGHGISLAKRELRWAHGYCIDKASRGLLQQGSLF